MRTMVCDVCGRSEKIDAGVARILRGKRQLGPDVDVCEPCLTSVELQGLGNVLKAWKQKLWLDSPIPAADALQEKS